MEQAAEELRFEKAAELRDRYKAIELLGKRQKVVAGSLADTDVVGFHKGEATRSCFVVLHYVEGELAAKDWELIETPMEEDRADILSALVGQYYGGRGRLPRQILLPCELEDAVPLMRLLSEQAGHRVELVTPQRGAKMDLIRLANKNAVEEVERWTTREERQSKLMELLGRMLDLDAPPRRIESYDISNQGADDIVASMVVYVNAKPLKRDYRRFKLKDMDGPDDYASMEQVLTRRFQRYLDGDEKFSDKPDLLLIDGGVNHANVAVRVLESLRHGEGRPPPHPRPGHPRGKGDRHPGQPGHLLPHRPDPGGDPPLCHRVPPPAAEPAGARLGARPDPRRGGEAAG